MKNKRDKNCTNTVIKLLYFKHAHSLYVLLVIVLHDKLVCLHFKGHGLVWRAPLDISVSWGLERRSVLFFHQKVELDDGKENTKNNTYCKEISQVPVV